MDILDIIYDKVCCELEDIGKKEKLDSKDVELMDKFVDIMKDIEVSEKIVDLIMMRVIYDETRNLRTEKYSSSELVKKHIKTIKEYTKELVNYEN